MREAGIAITVFGLLCLILPIGILIATQPKLQPQPYSSPYLYWIDATEKNGTITTWMVYGNCTLNEALNSVMEAGNYSSVSCGPYPAGYYPEGE
jgi:cytochrome c oxidase assembly factor CtaG